MNRIGLMGGMASAFDFKRQANPSFRDMDLRICSRLNKSLGKAQGVVA